MVFFFIYISKYYCLTVNTTMFFITLLYYSLLVSVILYNPHLNVRNALIMNMLPLFSNSILSFRIVPGIIP